MTIVCLKYHHINFIIDLVSLEAWIPYLSGHFRLDNLPNSSTKKLITQKLLL